MLALNYFHVPVVTLNLKVEVSCRVDAAVLHNLHYFLHRKRQSFYAYATIGSMATCASSEGCDFLLKSNSSFLANLSSEFWLQSSILTAISVMDSNNKLELINIAIQRFIEEKKIKPVPGTGDGLVDDDLDDNLLLSRLISQVNFFSFSINWWSF